jgi:hypothetical protein
LISFTTSCRKIPEIVSVRLNPADFQLLECKKIDEENFDIDLKRLTEFGVSVRYPDDFYIPGVKETSEYIEMAEEIKLTVESLLRSVLNEK